jgi:hypothetical protein
MAGVNRRSKIRATAFFISPIDGSVQASFEVRTDGRNQMPTGGKPEYANSIWPNVP